MDMQDLGSSRLHRWVVIMTSMAEDSGFRNINRKPKPGWERWRPPSPERGHLWGFQGKTVWDWLQLLIVPLMLALITVVFAWQQDARQHELQEQNAQDAALQAYLDQMNQYLLEKGLRGSDVNSEIRTLARAQTITVLQQSDPEHRSQVLRFLMEAELVQGKKGVDLHRPNDTYPIISLRQANLAEAAVAEPDFEGADLQAATLSDVRLLSANFQHAFLVSANLSGADLSNVDGYPHSGASFIGADLTGADLSGANLRHASGITEKSLERDNVTLTGTTMPDGTRHP
jgi:uncharacterized protein YjbI with pentapeptide repeats